MRGRSARDREMSVFPSSCGEPGNGGKIRRPNDPALDIAAAAADYPVTHRTDFRLKFAAGLGSWQRTKGETELPKAAGGHPAAFIFSVDAP